MNQSAYIIKHMGRMIYDQFDTGRFAGSTTGVPFISSVEELCSRLSPTLGHFDEDCFRMHLLQPEFKTRLETMPHPGLPGRPPTVSATWTEVGRALNYSDDFYLKQIDMFNESWGVFVPVFPHDHFLRNVNQVLTLLKSSAPLQKIHISTLYSLLVLLEINQISGHHPHEQDAPRADGQYLDLALTLHADVVAGGGLFGLQSLIIFSFYLQISRRTLLLVEMNGILVRLAQSLGLHRHARRFRFCRSEVELRNRMWWWVYGFDK